MDLGDRCVSCSRQRRARGARGPGQHAGVMRPGHRLPLPQHERITDAQQEKLLVIATLEEPTRHEVVLPEQTEDGTQPGFPSALRHDVPSAAEPWGDR